MFSHLELKNWRQFDNVALTFHPSLTILTGANGAGKTTLLNLLNRHFGWDLYFLGVPGRRKDGVFEYDSGFWERRARFSDPQLSYDLIGEVGYTSGFRAQIALPRTVGETFQPELRAPQPVNGLFIPSHRPNYLYQRVTQIPTHVPPREALFDAYATEVRSRYISGSGSASPSFRIKEALISLATFGFGSEVVERNEEAVQTFQGFEEVLRVVLPPSLGFRRLEVRMPDIILDTGTGPFPFDAVSGGVAAVIDLAWQMYTFSLRGGPFVAIIDEPENHLHPELQQRLLPTFIEAFPHVQFIAATHNPFIVSAVRDSTVYALRYGDNGRVFSTRLSVADKAGTADEVLREVLGVPVTLPLWAFHELERIVSRFADGELSDARAEDLRTDLERAGLGELYPRTLADVLRRRVDDPVRREVKSALIADTHGKCAYCESAVTHVYPGDVEHIRPKSARPDLVVAWDNLIFACARCNGAKHDYHDEGAPLLNPYEDEPHEHLIFVGSIVWHCPGSALGWRSWQRLDLQRDELVERRGRRLRSVGALIDVWYALADGPDKELARRAILAEAEDDKEFAAAVRAFIDRIAGLTLEDA